MKTIKIKYLFQSIGLFVLMGITMTGCAGHQVMTRSVESQRMIHYSEIQKWDETKTLNNYVIYINPGETIPMAISIDTDFVALKQNQIDLVAKQKLYFLIEMKEDLTPEEVAKLNTLNAQSFANMSPQEKDAFLKDYKLYISRDAVHWAPLYDGRAVGKAMGCEHGEMSAGMFVSTTNGLGTSLNIKTIK